ncbi:MAG: AhpC/TSA family protein [Chlorobi bacterium]|nr:AhpC/TSA family protein [Chlorobiota bacterium]
MRIKTIIGLLILISIVSCKNETEKANTVIKGDFPGLAGKRLFLDELEIHNVIQLDSVVLGKKGEFRFDLNLSVAGFYLLRNGAGMQILLLLEKGENVGLKAKGNPFTDGYEVSGSPGSKLLKGFEGFMDGQKQRVDSLAMVYNEASGTPGFYPLKLKLDSIYGGIVLDQKRYVGDFVAEHPTSLASLFVLNSKLGNTVVLDEEQDFGLFKALDSALMLKYPENKHAIDHHKRVLEIKARIYDKFMADEKLSPGNSAPGLVMKDTTGELFSLRNFKGQTVLLYFWAGWNAKSRLDNRKLVPMYEQLKKKGVEIFGVSLDENEHIWKGAIRLDELPWVQGSDLMGFNSPANIKFNLNSKLPMYYIIDAKGKIVDKDKDLDAILKKLDDFLGN